MKEQTIVVIISVVLLAAALGSAFYFTTGDSYYTEFNFYKSFLKVNERNVTERLYYVTNKEYHTLFRTFSNPIVYTADFDVVNSIRFVNASCSSGIPYLRTINVCYLFRENRLNECLPYTEPNEYGCTFGDYLGFERGKEYWIESSYQLNPSNLFLIKEKYYIKFVAYTPNNHVKLEKGKNLFITGEAVSNDLYLTSNNVVIYIPYNGEISGFNIARQDDFEFDKNKSSLTDFIRNFIIALIPLLIFLVIWWFFGREKSYKDVPDQLSQIPNKRKAWEVAAYFNPPFSQINKDFFATMLFDFYRRKIIDIKYKEGFLRNKTLIKINYSKRDVDEIENDFLDILKKLDRECDKEDKENGYFDLRRESSGFSTRFWLQSDMKDINKKVKEAGKEYLDKKGLVAFWIIGAILFYASFFFGIKSLIVPNILAIVLVSLVHSKKPLLMSYKKDFYIEFQEWQAFKKWLSYSDSMKNSKHDAVVLWQEYLVYAAALGVSKKVLQQLKKMHVIDDRQYATFSYAYVSSGGFASSSGASGGGFGGAGGGGVGGGGGGGR